MKKKILLTLLVAMMLVCALAISVSAEKIGGIEYTLNTANKTATFAASNRTDCTLTRVVIPEIVVGADGQTYTVTTIADRSIGHQDANAGNKYIEYLYIPKTVTYLGAQLVRNCYALKEVKIDASVTKLSAGDFWSCSNLETLDLSGMTQLTTLDQITSATPKLKTVKLPNTVTTIGGKAFQSCGSITSITLPNGLTTIGSNTFQSTKIEKLVLPATLTSVGGAAFHSVSTIHTLVFANTSFDGWSTNVTFNGVNPTIIFFAGSDPTTLTNHYTQWASYSTMKYADYLKNPSSAAARTIVYDTDNCSSCSDVATGETTFVYKDYLSAMQDKCICGNCNAESIVKTYDPMFKFLGYSAPEKEGVYSFCVGYSINNESIKVFEEKTGKTASFGVVAVATDRITDGKTPLEMQGTVPVINAQLTGIKMGSVSLKITGFSEAQKSIQLTMALYVITTKNEESSTVYLQKTQSTSPSGYSIAQYEADNIA